MIESRMMGCRATKPGYGEPEPLKPAQTMDTPENVAMCQACQVPYDCNPKSLRCPLRKRTKLDSVLERDARVRDLINAGWVNNEAICEEVGISKSTLTATKRRLRERGEIT